MFVLSTAVISVSKELPLEMRGYRDAMSPTGTSTSRCCSKRARAEIEKPVIHLINPIATCDQSQDNEQCTQAVRLIGNSARAYPAMVELKRIAGLSEIHPWCVKLLKICI